MVDCKLSTIFNQQYHISGLIHFSQIHSNLSHFLQVCVGSSLFLKARFGNGYYLTLVRDDGITKALEELEQDGQQQQQQQEGLLSPKEEECNSLEEVIKSDLTPRVPIYLTGGYKLCISYRIRLNYATIIVS